MEGRGAGENHLAAGDRDELATTAARTSQMGTETNRAVWDGLAAGDRDEPRLWELGRTVPCGTASPRKTEKNRAVWDRWFALEERTTVLFGPKRVLE